MPSRAKKKTLKIELDSLFALYIAVSLGDISIFLDEDVKKVIIAYLLDEIDGIVFDVAPVSEELNEILEKVLTEDSKEILLDGKGAKIVEILKKNKEKLRASLLCNNI